MIRKTRVKLIRQQIINKLDKYDRRIQQIAESAYKLRQFLAKLDAQENERAICENETEGSISSGSLDNGSGGADISDSATPTPVLAEQSAELRHDSGNIGSDSGR